MSSVRIIKKPAPLKNALLCVSLTTNLFLAAFALAIATGHLARTVPVTQEQETAAVNLTPSDQYANLYRGGKR